MTIRFLNMILIAGLVGLGACSITPTPDYAIKVVPAADGHPAQAIPPTCPRWSDNDLNFFDNQPLPQFGCADARNLAMEVERPEDLLQGRNPGPSRGVISAGNIMRYDNNQTRGLIDLQTQPDTAAANTTAPIPNSKLTGETPESSGGSSDSS